jgi:probable F420-dependent oxidoreductase
LWDDAAVRFGVYIASGGSVGLKEIARRAEDLGFESLFVPDHTHLASRYLAEHPDVMAWHPDPSSFAELIASIPDPFVSLAVVAAVTERLRVGTGICLVAQRNPLVVAKQVATLDVVSGGRFIFGIGAGWIPGETANHGIAHEQRFAVMRERILAMKALWTGEEVSFSGTHVRFEGARQRLTPIQKPHPPILIGGMSSNAVDAAGDYCDGWFPIHEPGIANRIGDLRTTVIFTESPPEETLEKYAAVGIERIVLDVGAGDASTLNRLAGLVRRHIEA